MDTYRAQKPQVLLIIIILFFSSCYRNHPANITRSYYFWRMGEISFKERTFLKTHNIRKLYCHLMDVDWSETLGAFPVVSNSLEKINYEFNAYDSFPVEIVPVVFITNKTFERINTYDIELLAKRLVRRCLPSYDQEDVRYEISHNMKDFGGPIHPREIQFDCDWTTKTKEKYFLFLSEVKRLVIADSIRVSVTIRLHQFKYPQKTGVPPVDRGMLMVYNISDPKQYTPINSVFDERKAAAYFTRSKPYPLPLDIVLPAYSWCLVFRNQQFYQIENEMTVEELQHLPFLHEERKGWYSVIKDTVYKDLFLRPGDELKMETIDERTVGDAARLAQKAVNTDHFSVSLFDLSENEIKNYSRETFNQVYCLYQ